VPKWLLAGVPNANVTFENLTSAPPRTQIVIGDGLPNGAGPPLPVIVAVPVITNPSVTTGLNAGHFVVQSVLSMPSVMLMWCVWAPRVAGSSLLTVFWVIPATKIDWIRRPALSEPTYYLRRVHRWIPCGGRSSLICGSASFVVGHQR
jgi:hypothetical protein